jgi:hypothetical protein
MKYKHGMVAGVLLILGAAVWSGTAFAEKTPKNYPEHGKIVATGWNQFSVNGATARTHTYTVTTEGKRYVLECHKRGVFSSTGEECGGDKKLQIGDMISFRIEKDSAFIPITEKLSPVAPPKQEEQKLRILSQELNPEIPDKPAAQPQK